MKILFLACLALLLGSSGCPKSHDSTIADGNMLAGQDGKTDASSAKPAVAPRGEMKDGKRSGVWTFFHAQGRKSAEGEYSDGLKNGKWTFWDEAGNKIAEGGYLAGQKDGKWTEWGSDGKQVSEHMFKNGQEIFK
jgi:hypothetical protein